MSTPMFDVVVPTIGRPSLVVMLRALAAAEGPMPGAVIVVDDRPGEPSPLALDDLPPGLAARLVLLRSGGRGPAAARNVGWRAARASWVAFLDDDVVPDMRWLRDLDADLGACAPGVAGSQGIIHVPLPADRRPTDWERNVHGLERARWATADLAYRRDVLAEVGGFDEGFPRAYREDADLGLRVTAAGYRIVTGRRRIVHPVRPADRWVSVRLQRGNADDARMHRRHGADWRARAGVSRGRRARHVAVTAAAGAALVALALGRRRAAALAAAVWAAGTTELAWARIAPGPRTREEVITMLATSLLLPVAASWHWCAGWWRSRTTPRAGAVRRPRAVLFDRDGTLVVDVPFNGDPERVRLVDGAREAIERLRAAGVPFAMVTNQSGVARGLLTLDDVAAVNRRVDELLGASGSWWICPHGPDDGCGCRKPAPGLVRRAAAALGVAPEECVVIGDTAADVAAAQAAGARGVLVPNPVTRREEISAAPEVAPDVLTAVERLLGEKAA
ncbi:MAG TPA: HAD-IIIA family hydrolase [Terriglobales bacterium]|nr:HAD-IIIA family hydrolase [Terriglobales bacterium]